LRYVTAHFSLVHNFNRLFAKNVIPAIVSKSLLLAAFIVSDLNSGHLSDPCILA
jgi:hypothetical protein